MRLHLANTQGKPPLRIDVPEENVGSYVRYAELGLTVLPSMMGGHVDPIGIRSAPIINKKWGKTPADLSTEHSRWLYDQEKARSQDSMTTGGVSMMLMNNSAMSPVIGRQFYGSMTAAETRITKTWHRSVCHTWDLDENGKPMTWWTRLIAKVRTWLMI